MRAVFLDRDGTIARDVSYCSKAEDFALFPDAAGAIKLLNAAGFRVVVVTNQSGVGRGYFTEETLAQIHQKMERELREQGAFVDAIYYCPHHPDDGCECRKPKGGMFRKAAERFGIEFDKSFMVGDMAKDIEAGKALGCKTVLVKTGSNFTDSVSPDYAAQNILEAVQWIIENK